MNQHYRIRPLLQLATRCFPLLALGILSIPTAPAAGVIATGEGSHEIEVVAVPFPANVPLSLGGATTPPNFFRIRADTP